MGQTVKEYLKDHLQKDGFDGLCNPGECGCTFRHGHDFIPCDSDFSTCEPAYLRECDPNNPEEAEYAYIMTNKKPVKK